MNLVYLHRNKLDGKVYIGRTCNINNPNKRWLNGYGYKKQPFYNVILEVGWDNFEHIILETNIPNNLIDKRENYWIQYYKADNPKFGYNHKVSGSVNEITRQKMKENWHNDPQRAEKQRIILKENSKNLNNSGINHPMYGSNRSGKNAGRKRKVQCIETGEIFETLTDASNWCNPNGSNLRSHIAQQISGKRKYCGRHPETNIKLHWRYID